VRARRPPPRRPPHRRAARLVLVALVGVLALGATYAAGRWWRPGAADPASWKTWLGIAPRKSAADVAARGERAPRPAPPGPVLTFYQELTAPLTPTPLPPRPQPAPAPRAVPAPPAGRDEHGALREGTRFTIQVGAYRTRDAAQALQARLAASGHEAYIAESHAPDGGVRYRVRVGSFVSQEAARAAVARLAMDGQLSTYVTTR
jgi:cell division protein FtsN